ncbi:MAG: hypothetical protein EP336_18010 [Rhodobacteraceae bacterium]|nr:MAG: hypothetical protein EP336_18010 [Paracoccaceae bacterium]
MARMEIWITYADLKYALEDNYNSAILAGHSHDAAVAHAAAFLTINRDQLIHPSVSVGIVEHILAGIFSGTEGKD